MCFSQRSIEYVLVNATHGSRRCDASVNSFPLLILFCLRLPLLTFLLLQRPPMTLLALLPSSLALQKANKCREKGVRNNSSAEKETRRVKEGGDSVTARKFVRHSHATSGPICGGRRTVCAGSQQGPKKGVRRCAEGNSPGIQFILR